MKEKCFKKNWKEKKIWKMKYQIELKLWLKQKRSLQNLKKKNKENIEKIENLTYKLNR